MAVEGEKEPENAADFENRLSSFLDRNPDSKVEKKIIRGDEHHVVANPWNDKSLSIQLADDEQLFDALNNLILPERFTAVFHADRKVLEVIWTAYLLPEGQAEVKNRAFKFVYLSNSHKCHFSRSSDRLLKLAEYIIPIRMSGTSFRNMQSFDYYVKKQKNPDAIFPSIDEPFSFFIENIDLDRDDIVELTNNLNFYLKYYDNHSPIVMLHQIDEDEKPAPRLRYISGKFPTHIKGKKLDNNLLSFWEASSVGDAARRFQYYYRIIEYSSFFYLESASKSAVKRILESPDAMDDISSTSERLMSAMQMSKLDEFAKFSQLMHDTIDPKFLWSEIKENISAFSKDIKFDGGYVLKAIISSTTKESTFCPRGVEVFIKSIRDIRNALSHGRDFKTSSVIMPTLRNFKALQPWVHLIAIASGQVVLYKDIN
jgi:hypothetical protein